jgi:CubicO group peptidase (beta-lactamase class C family)
MNDLGLSKPRLERMHRVLSEHVERGTIPGLVALVSRHDDQHVETLGAMSLGRPKAMQRDTIFRIASMSKPITAVAAMILVEKCQLRLDDSVEPWLPELARRRVLRRLDSEVDDTVPALRAITVRDLLTFRMGFGSVMAMPSTYPIQKLIRERRIGADGPLRPSRLPAGDEWLKRLGSLPWMAQPGERWLYHVSADVLGLLIARVSGQSLGAFLRQRIFEPLGMKDTGFYVPPNDIERFASSYSFSHRHDSLVVFDDAANSAWRAPPSFESGAGGLVSTMDDCLVFYRMLLNKGRHGRERILSRPAVELMTSDQLTREQRVGADIFFGSYRSWGLGVGVDIARDQTFHNPGRFGWDGGFGTSGYADPGEQLIGLLFTQRLMDSPKPPKVFTDFWTLTYGAVK